ncbi:MAG TPA: hypothetical protein PKC69_02865 [Chitinophagaceae bacterium]|nr:hypothetical protein [Chitinophagaceae bacterium]
MRWYKFLFYKYYSFAEAIGNKGFFPEVNAWFLATVMPWFNLMAFLELLELSNLISVQVSKIIAYGSLSIWVLTFIYFILLNKYELILEEYKGSDVKKGNIIVLLYSLITIGLYFWVS